MGKRLSPNRDFIGVGIMKILFISWLAHCRRNDALATKLGGKSLHINYLDARRGSAVYAAMKYFMEATRTLLVLLRERPSIVFVSVPPIFSALIVYIFGVFSGPRFIIDAHTGSLDGAWRHFVFLHKFLSKRALTTIVTNEYLKEMFSKWKINVTILGDIAIDFPEVPARYLSNKFKLAYINGFAGDEPVEVVLRVASELPQVEFYVTGNLKHDRKNLRDKYPLSNVTFTDFLPDEDYLRLLKSVDAAMVLTTKDHTMQRGAYEAMSMGKPIIVSDWPVLRETFYKGAVYVANEEEKIREGILNMMADRRRLSQEVLELREERSKVYQEKILSLRGLIALVG